MATVKFYIRKTKEPTINLVFTIDRQHRVEVATGERLDVKYWDSARQISKSNYRGHVELNQSLSRLKDQIIQVWRDNKSADFHTLKRMIRDVVKYGDSSKKKSALTALKQFISANEHEKASQTVAKYKTLLSVLNEFNPEIGFEDMNFTFYDRFKAFLFTKPNPNYPGQYLKKNSDHWIITKEKTPHIVPIFDDSVYRHFITLKTFLKWAAKRGHNVDPTFTGWEIIRRHYPPISLSIDELRAIESVQLTKAIHDISRDYLAIECRTGQRISDIKAFSSADFENNTWSFFRKKGSRMSARRVTVHFTGYCAPALSILLKHDFKVPKVSEQKINQNIKEVCRLAGISKEVTIERWAGNKRILISGPKHEFISTHTGRKTFITIALQYMPPMVVKALTGIEDYKTLKHYEGESDSSIVRGYLNKIEEPKLKVG